MLERQRRWLPGAAVGDPRCDALASAALLWSWAPRRRGDGVAPALLGVALVGALAGPAAYAVATVGAPHQGIGPSVGPARHGDWTCGGRTTSNPRLDAMLEATDTPWSAAIDRSSTAAGLELATDTAVMAIGGFSGTDPTPTLQQFQDDVAKHRVAYYLAHEARRAATGRPARAQGESRSRAHPTSCGGSAATFRPRRSAASRCTTCSRRSGRALPDEAPQQRRRGDDAERRGDQQHADVEPGVAGRAEQQRRAAR